MSLCPSLAERTEERVRRGYPGGSGTPRQQAQEALRAAIDAARGRGGGRGVPGGGGRTRVVLNRLYLWIR